MNDVFANLILLLALWTSPHSARITWIQPENVQLTCLIRQGKDGSSALINCWPNLSAGPKEIDLGDVGPLDGNQRPRDGDTFKAIFDGQSVTAPLMARLYAPIVQNTTIRRYYLPTVKG